MIKSQLLTYTYQGGKKIHFPDIICQPKEILLVLGSSGVGKSTLLHLISGLLTIQEGEVLINNTSLSRLNKSALDEFRGNNIGIIFQQNHFVQSLNVLENIVLASTLAGKRINKEYALELLERLSIGDKADSNIQNLSQGEKQRVAIIRAIINKPSVILADEPTSALDDRNCEEVLKILKEQSELSNSALVVVTHDTRLKELISNQVMFS